MTDEIPVQKNEEGESVRSLAWASVENLKTAWKYARIDLRDNFVFDVINHDDIKQNIESALYNLSNQITTGLYTPSPIFRIDIPKNEYTIRPGTVISTTDLIVLYALMQQISPLIDPTLSRNTYAYRLNPKSPDKNEPLFSEMDAVPETNPEVSVEKNQESEDDDDDVGFPYDWFANWKIFQELSLDASKSNDLIASTDITAFFENISLTLLREMLIKKMPAPKTFLAERLINLFEYWDWRPDGNLPQSIGLPQGNDVSAFLSNIYLAELDEEIDKLVGGKPKMYFRYVDDIRIFTNDRKEANQALLTTAKILRKLNLHLQSSKTKISSSRSFFEEDVEQWSKKLGKKNTKEEQISAAVQFWEDVLNLEEIAKWQRPFLQCLRVFREQRNGRATEVAMNVFLTSSSHKLISGTFSYLRDFSAQLSTSSIGRQKIFDSIQFPFHRAMLLRLAAYCRDEGEGIKDLAFAEAVNDSAHWFPRMAAVFCLSSYHLDSEELKRLHQIVLRNPHPLLARSLFVLLCQTATKEQREVRDELSIFIAPHQEFLLRYFISLYGNVELGRQKLKEISNSSIGNSFFFHNLYKLDIIKTSRNKEIRERLIQIVELKIGEASLNDWPRLLARLRGIAERTARFN